MKIALIRQEQTGGDGGAQAIIDIMLRTLQQTAHIDVSLICRQWVAQTGKDKGEMSDNPGCQVVLIDPAYKGREDKQRSFNQAVKQYISEHPYDLVQSHERLEGCHIFRAGDGVHKIWLQHKASISNRLQRWWLSRSSYHQSLMAEEQQMFESDHLKQVICNSHMIKQEILDNFDITEDKISVIYNGVDREKFKPVNTDEKRRLQQLRNIPENHLTFLFSGSGFERKNLANTLKAFSFLSNDCFLIVAGRDKKAKYYQKLAKQLGCGDRVKFIGAQPRELMPSIYQIADVLVLPSLYDPFPNAILEALATGLPCISSVSCGAIDVIPSQHCGMVVDALDIDALSLAMDSYLDTAKLKRESQNSLSAAEQFSPDIMQKKLLDLYSALTEESHV